MESLMHRVNTIEERLDNIGHVFNKIQQSLNHEQSKRHHSVRGRPHSGKPPDWVQKITKYLDELGAEIRNLKATVGTHSLDIRSHPRDREAPAAETEAEVLTQSQPQKDRDAPAAETQVEARVQSLPHPNQDASVAEIQTEVPQRNQIRDQAIPNSEKRPFDVPERSRIASLTPQASRLQPQLGRESQTTFRCSLRDISGKLNEKKLKQFSANTEVLRKGYFKLVVEDLPPLVVDNCSQPTSDHSTHFSAKREASGFVTIKREPNQAIELPNFPLYSSEKQSWTHEELKEIWESTLMNPPPKMEYISGDPLFKDIELDPGLGMRKLAARDVPGLGTTYAYLGIGRTCSIIHGEDAKLRSLNLLRSGEPKLWLLIYPGCEQKFERRISHFFSTTECSQAIRHLDLCIPPSVLDEWGIQYSLEYCRPGEAMLTEEGTLHQVLNMGSNYALAINIMYASSPPVPPGYRFCSTRCCPNPITRTSMQTLSQHPASQQNAQNDSQPSRRRPLPAAVPELVKRKRNDNFIGKPPKVQKLTTCLDRLVQAISGRDAFHNLCSLISNCRDETKAVFKLDPSKSRAGELFMVVHNATEKSLFFKFQSRLAKAEMAVNLDSNKDGRISADPSEIDKILRGSGLALEKKNREKIHSVLRDGRKWNRVCGDFDGLLCLIPLNHEDETRAVKVSGREYQELSKEDIQRLHSLLKSNEIAIALCRMGHILQTSILNNEEVPEFRWESEDPQKVASMPMTKLIPLMECFPIADKNIYASDKYDWPKPDDWKWEWPQDPTWVPPSHPQCDQCSSQECDCIDTCLPLKRPRITNEGAKGQGVRSYHTIFHKGQILGQLTGELAPLDTYKDSWAIEFKRPDHGDEPIAQIYTKSTGNWVRKVNHACKPSAEFRVMKISGRWRQMLVAVRDIHHNDEITAFCGSSFLKAQGKRCLCDSCSSQSQ